MAGRDPEYLIVGHLAKAHGTRGEVVVRPLTDRPEEVFAPGVRLVLGDDGGEAGAAPERVGVEGSRPHKGGLLVKLEGVEDRNAAEALASRYVLLPRSELGEAGEGEWYYHQILGLAVETTAGEVVGRVREVFETEPDHLLEVKGPERVHLIPFSRRIVRAVDLEAGRLVIDPPEGLLEL